LTPDQLANRSSRPQGKWQRQLVRELATNQLLSPALFLRRQRTQTALRASTARHALQQRRGCRQALEHRRYVAARVSGDLRDLQMGLALIAQHQHLSTQLKANIGAGSSAVWFLEHVPLSHNCPVVTRRVNSRDRRLVRRCAPTAPATSRAWKHHVVLTN